MKQKQRLHKEAKENKRIILYFPSADDVSGRRASVHAAVAPEDKHCK